MTHIRIGNIPRSKKKLVPFRKENGRVSFNPRPGVNIDYGVSFDPAKGHRVFFNYADTPEFKNTWGPESLRKWALSIDQTLAEHRIWRTICLQQCDLAEEMEKAWRDAGCPPEGVAEPKRPVQ